jgi:hypothetical protein
MRPWWMLAAVALCLGCSLGAPPSSQWPAPELAARLGCFACHQAGGRGGQVAAPLDGVGRRLTASQLDAMLTYPRQIHAGARMPSYAYLPAPERRKLKEFLTSLP